MSKPAVPRLTVRQQLNEMFGKADVDYAIRAAREPLGKPPCICKPHSGRGKTVDNDAWSFMVDCPIHGDA